MGRETEHSDAAIKELSYTAAQLERVGTTIRFDGCSIKTAAALTNSRRQTIKLLNSIFFQTVLGLCILLNMVLIIIETDAEASQGSLPIPPWVQAANRCLLVIYVLELSCRIYAFRGYLFYSIFNCVDLLVVVIDCFMELSKLILSEGTLLPFSILRIARLARLSRSYRVLIRLPVLSSMVRDLIPALEACFWGCVLLFTILTVWSIFAVHFIQPYVEELTEIGMWDNLDCERCRRSFSTVMNSNLTFIQQIIVGDAWGEVTLPIIEYKPWTAFFFVVVLVTTNLAIMNVILVIMVEQAEESRKGDAQSRQEARENSFITKSKELIKLCSELDKGGDGVLTLEEILTGFDMNQPFRDLLRDMGIEKEDMDTVFMIMDSDHSGSVDYVEFVRHIYKMKTADEQTLLNFIRHYTTLILRSQLSFEKTLRDGMNPNPVAHGGSTTQAEYPYTAGNSGDVDNYDQIILQSHLECASIQAGNAAPSARSTSDTTILDELHRLREQISSRLGDDLTASLREFMRDSKSFLAQLSLIQARFWDIGEKLSSASSSTDNVCSTSDNKLQTAGAIARLPRLPHLPRPPPDMDE